MSGTEQRQNTSSHTLRIAVLISGNGSNLQALIDAVEEGQLPGVEIALVISNQADAQGLQRALQHKIPALYLPWKKRAEAEARVATLLDLFHVELIVLAGFMRILGTEFTVRYPQRIINLHPSLLPDSGEEQYTTSNGTTIPALRGLNVVQQALDLGLTVTGSTVHYVIPAVDAGPVISRAEIRIEAGDTEEILHEKLKSEEHRLIVTAVRAYAEKPRLVNA